MSPTTTPMTGSSKKRRMADTTSVFNFGWILFLVCRGRIMDTNPPDYIKSIYVLFCVFDFLLYHVPDNVCKQEVYRITSRLNPLTQTQNNNADSILALCDTFAIATQVKIFQESIFHPFISNLCNKAVLSYSAHQIDDHQKLHLEGLMSHYFGHNMKSLDKEYTLIMSNGSGDFDDRLFLSNHSQVQPVSSGSSETQFKWFTELMESNKSLVSESLKNHFQGCSQGEPDKFIETCISSLMEQIQFPADNETRQHQIKVVYYYLLEAIINQEGKRLNVC